MKKIEEIEVGVAEVVDYLKMTGGFRPALREVVARKVTAQSAKERGLKVTDKELQKAADAFRLINGLSKSSDTQNWLKSNGISIEVFEDFLETNILISSFKDKLEKTTDKKDYIVSEGIKESIREMIYQDWLKEQMK